MKSACMLFCIALACTAANADLSREDVVDLFSRGKELFRQANAIAGTDPEQAHELYRQSTMHFERIARDGGIHNGQLYYNIGNTYFRMKDVGRTILNYRRAQQYIPNDENLQQNLRYARARCMDRIEERQKTRILKTLFFWHYDLPKRVRSLLFAILFVMLWAAAATRLFVRTSSLSWCIAVPAILATLLLGSLVVEHVVLRTTNPGVIIETEVIARKGDSETYERSFKEPLHAGTEFRLVEKRGDWYLIALADSRTCWVQGKSVDLARDLM